MNPSVPLGLGATLLGVTLWAEAPELVLSRDQAVAQALQASPDLQALAIQARSSLDRYRWGLREYLPKVGLNYSQNESVLLDSPDTRSIQAGVTVNQLLFDAGRGGRRRDLSQIQLLVNRQDYRIQEEKITDSVTSLFNQLLVVKKKREIQARAIDLAEKQLALSRAERGLGLVRDLDVLGAEVQVASLWVDSKQSDRSLKDALSQLAGLLGLDPSVRLDVAGAFDTDYVGLVVPEHSDRWLALVLDSSKDLALQRLELRKQYFDLLNSQLWFLPDVSLQSSVSLTGVGFPLQTPAYNLTLTFSFPSDALPFTQTMASGGTPGQNQSSSVSSTVGVFDSVQGLVDGSAAQAQYQVSQVREGVLKAASRLAFEKTLGDYRLLVEKLALQRRAVTLEERKIFILGKQVELGETKRLDYLQGETQLAQDRIALVESVLQLKESERTLEQLLHREPGTLAQAVEEEKQ